MISAAVPTTNRQQSGKYGGTNTNIDRTMVAATADTQLNVVTTILGGPKDGDSARQKKKLLRASSQEGIAGQVNVVGIDLGFRKKFNASVSGGILKIFF